MDPKRLFKIYIFLICAFACGCSVLPFRNQVPPKEPVRQTIEETIDVPRLSKGGNLLIIPFRAGNKVAATAQLERISMMAVKGMIDAIDDNVSPFKIMNSNNAEASDLIIRGHVTQFTSKKDGRRLMRSAKPASLTIEGRIIDRETGASIFSFKQSKVLGDRSVDETTLGYELGQDIAKYILESLRMP